MNEDSNRHDASYTESAVNDWLEGTVADCDNESLAGTIDKAHAADLLLINSLVEMTVGSGRSRREERIERAMSAIRNDLPSAAISANTTMASTPATSNGSRRAVVWVTTAVLLVSAALLMQTTNPRRQVHAAIDQIRQATASTADREYRVTLSFVSPDDAQAEQGIRKIQGTLFVRGGEAFVVRAPALLRSGEVWFGRDREGAWFKPAVGPVQAGPGAVLMQQRFLRGSEDSAPFLQLTTVINRLSESYDVELLPRDAWPHEHLPAAVRGQHVLGTLRTTESPLPWLPDRVEIHAEPGTGTVMRLLLVWNRETVSLLKRVEFDFVEQSKKPDNWYRPEGRNMSQPVLR